MPRCNKCTSQYFSVFGSCPVCGASEYEDEQPRSSEQYTPDQLKKERIKSWITICVGVPLLIGMIYVIIYFMGALKGAQ